VDRIPDQARDWGVAVRGAEGLAATLRERRAEARLFRTLATLRTDVPLGEWIDDLRWHGPRRADLARLCSEIGDGGFAASL
jgi:hypothetical protein